MKKQTKIEENKPKWREKITDITGSKEDTLQSTLNKGDPMWGCYQTVFYGVVSRDTVVVRSRGFSASPEESECSMVLSILESLKT